MNERNHRFSGLIAAPHTPFEANGALNLAVIPRQAAKLLADGVKGAFVCGSTGEGVSMTTAERIAVTNAWVEATRGTDLRVIAHVGHTSQGDAIVLASRAQASGACAVAAMAPFYFVPGTVDALLDWLAPIAAAASDSPFYYYHIPVLTGANLPMLPLLEGAAKRIPNFAGIKYTNKDLMEYTECLRWDAGRYEILWGCDEWMLPALSVGAQAFVGSTYNYSAGLYHQLIDAFRAGHIEAARQHSDRVMASVRELTRFPGVAAGKAIMAGCGIPVGPPRPPLRALSAAEAEGLYKRHVELGAI